MENDTNKKPAKKGWGHIVILFLLAAYFFRIFVVYLYVGSKTGMIEILLQKGAIRTVLSPIIAILFMAAAIYELICYRRGCGKKPYE